MSEPTQTLESTDDSIETKVREAQLEWKQKAEQAVFRGTTKKELYKEARLIDAMLQKVMANHNWASAYYHLFLYLTICLNNNLHRGDKSSKDVAQVVENLNKIEKKLDIAKRGMVFQYSYAASQERKQHEERQKREAEKAARQAQIAAIAAVAPATSGAGAATVGAMSVAQMKDAMDALRLPGQSASVIPEAIAAASAPVMGTLVPPQGDDIPPPPYNGSTRTHNDGQQGKRYGGGMTETCTLPESAVTTLVLKPVLGDGSCAFRSIAQGMNQGRLNPDQEKREADKLRQLAVRLLKVRGQEEMVGTGMTIEQVVLMKDSYTSYGAYCNAMSKSEYAGETEFWLLAEELQINIAIFMESEEGDGGLEHMITYGTAPSQPVCLFWQRGARSEAGNHYDCLLFENK